MTTTYKSNLVLKKNRMRPINTGEIQNYTGRIFLPSGTVLSVGDILLYVPVGENQAVLSVNSLELGDVAAAAASFGYFQILDNAGNPVVVERKGHAADSSTKYTSPATNATAFQAATALEGYVDVACSDPIVKLAGPVYMGLRITTGATVAADTELMAGCRIMGETSSVLVVGTQAPSGSVNDYLITTS